MAASEGTGQVTAPAPDRGRVVGREEARQRRPPGGLALAPGEDRSCRCAARQPHVADAKLLVSDLFRVRAPDNRDCARSVQRPLPPITTRWLRTGSWPVPRGSLVRLTACVSREHAQLVGSMTRPTNRPAPAGLCRLISRSGRSARTV